MADNPYVNKVEYGGQTLIDLSGDTVTAADVIQGKTFHMASGAPGNGGFVPSADNISYDSAESGLSATNVQDAVDELANGKQDALTVDSTPTSGSSNPVTSGGVYTGLSGKAPTNHRSTSTTYGTGTASYYGHLKLSDSTSSTSGTSGGFAATPSAVKSVADNLATFVRPNLLDNWYFVGGGSQQGGGQFPINQRGQTSYTAAGYTIDRWSAHGYVNVALNGDCIVVTKSNSESYRGIYQTTEQIFESGQRMTLSVLFTGPETKQIRATINQGTTMIKDEYPAVTTANKKMLYSVSFDTVSKSNITISLRPNVVSALNLYAAKLELGDTQTLAHQDSNSNWVLNEIPDYATELEKCQRYCYVMSFPSYGVFAVMNAPIATFMRGFIPVPVTMRRAPTITKTLTSIAASGAGISKNLATATFAVSMVLPQLIEVTVSEVTGLTQYENYTLIGYDGEVILSADL